MLASALPARDGAGAVAQPGPRRRRGGRAGRSAGQRTLLIGDRRRALRRRDGRGAAAGLRRPARAVRAREALLGLALTLIADGVQHRSSRSSRETGRGGCGPDHRGRSGAVGRRRALPRRRWSPSSRRATTELRRARDQRAQLEVGHRPFAALGASSTSCSSVVSPSSRGCADAAPRAIRTATLCRRSSTTAATTLDEMRDRRRRSALLRRALTARRNPRSTALIDLLPQAAGRASSRSRATRARCPPGVELSAYRIVEHLLVALDGAARDVAVRVRFGDDALELAVSGPTRRRRATLAIERARERVAAARRHARAARPRRPRRTVVAQLPVLAPV